MTHRSFYTENSLHRGDLHTEAFTQRHVYTYTQKVLQIEALRAHRNFYTEQLLHTEAFTQKSLYTEKFLHDTQKLFTPRSLIQRSFCAQARLPREAFTQRSFCTQKPFTHRTFCTE